MPPRMPIISQGRRARVCCQRVSLESVSCDRPERGSLRKIHHIIPYFPVITSLMLQFINIERIRKKSDVEHQIRIRRNPVLKPEGQYTDHQGIIFFIAYKNMVDLFL